MSVSSLTIVMAQVNFLVGDIQGNTKRVIALSQQARDEHDADLIVFPELTLTGYPPEDILLRPALSQLIEQALATIGREVSGIDVVLGYPGQSNVGITNAACVLRDGNIIARYAKQHLPNYSVFDEKRYFVPGTEHGVFDVRGVSVGLSICEDIWFPEVAAQAKAAGAQLLLCLNASPFHTNKTQDRLAVVTARATENNLPILYVQTIGGQDELVFDGGSIVVDGAGELCGQADFFAEALYPVQLDIDSEKVTIPPGPIALPMSEEASIYQALVLGVRDYVRKNGFQGVVIGLSGGMDSALTLAVAVDALGPEQVEAIMLPSRYTSQMSKDDAAQQAKLLACTYHEMPIDTVFQAFVACLADEFKGLASDVTEENIQARCRGVILMAISNKKGKLVLSTGNKSETAVGYMTLYGDMVGGFCVLKDVEKTWVYRLARYRNELSHAIPERVITRPPSAELAPDQKDSDTLPPYDVLDPILSRYIEHDKSIQEIVKEGFDEATVRRVAKLVDRNEYKRRQTAPGVRISQRAFGRDRRYPITSRYGESEAGSTS